MALPNGYAFERSEVDLEQLNDALVSSSTKWRLEELSRLQGQLAAGCK